MHKEGYIHIFKRRKIMKYETISRDILENVGGEKNVVSVSHCATRLRLTLKDDNLIKDDEIKKNKEILGTMNAGGQYQIIIGTDVAKYHEEIAKICNIDSENGRKDKFINAFLSYISGSMTPLMAPLIGSSILKGFLALFVSLNIMAGDSSTYAILSGISNAVFYFLPILVAFSAAKKLDVNPFIAACIGAALMEPSISALMQGTGSIVSFFGLPIMMFGYASSLFPSLIAIWLYAIAEKKMQKYVPKDLKLMVIPLVGLVVFVPLTLLVFGPFAFYLANGVSAAYNAIYAFSPILTGSLIGATFSFLVLFGLHWALIPICINDFAMYGFSSLYGLWLSANLAQWSLPFGVVLGTKNKEERNFALSCIFTALVSGVTEPIMFGIVLRNKKFIVPLVSAGAIGGALLGLFNNVSFGFVFLNLFSLPVIKANGSTALFIGLAVIEIIIGAVITKMYVYSKKNEVI
jgi:beta-glucoside PTS system EIICBA component